MNRLITDLAVVAASPQMRSGSFPLMNLAEDFGVDYGDVLLVSVWLGYAQVPVERQKQAAEAGVRIVDALGYQRWGRFVEAMIARRLARGGREWWPS